MNAVDTNVLIYAQDPRNPAKRQVANSLVRNLDDAVLLWQVACEYIAASRKLAPFGFSVEEAWDDVKELHATWAIALPNWEVHDRARGLMQRHGLSFWDALLVAAGALAEVDTL